MLCFCPYEPANGGTGLRVVTPNRNLARRAASNLLTLAARRGRPDEFGFTGRVYDTIGFIESVERMRGAGLTLAPTAMASMNNQWPSNQPISDLSACASAFHVWLHQPPNCVSSHVHCLIGAAALIPPRGTRFVDFSQSYQTTGTGFTLAGLRWLGVKSAALRYRRSSANHLAISRQRARSRGAAICCEGPIAGGSRSALMGLDKPVKQHKEPCAFEQRHRSAQAINSEVVKSAAPNRGDGPRCRVRQRSLSGAVFCTWPGRKGRLHRDR